MTERVLLVDYENIKDKALGKLPEADSIRLFVGHGQRMAKAAKPPADFVDAMMKAGRRLDLIPITATKDDNLDFYIAYYLAVAIAENPLAEYIVVSDDGDLDPLLKHLTTRGYKCRREETSRTKSAVNPPASKAERQKSANVRGAREFLETEKNPPKKRNKLEHRLQSHFGISESQGNELVTALEKDAFIKVGDKGKVFYLTKNTSPVK